MSDENLVSVKGGCLCGGVKFEVQGKTSLVSFCHCKQCRTWHGNFVGYTGSHQDNLVFKSSEALTWFKSSEEARRGFCQICGSSLFWDRLGSEGIAIAAGCLEDPTGLTAKDHIFVASAGDYYELDDDLHKFDGDHQSGV